MTVGAVLYYRNGCHLCEEMAAVLFRGWPDHADVMVWCDVDTRSEWCAEYGESVPVLTLGGEVVCALRPDIDRITQYFGAMTNPL